jgi:hypothetical protein
VAEVATLVGVVFSAASNAVGIWHETYLSRYAETIYVNTPKLGLARRSPVHFRGG